MFPSISQQMSGNNMEWNDNGMTRAKGVANGKGKRRRPTGRLAIATYRNNKRPNKRITKMFRQDQDGSADIEEKQRIQRQGVKDFQEKTS
jgi:predicted component of viral defense system (DUF524 family)